MNRPATVGFPVRPLPAVLRAANAVADVFGAGPSVFTPERMMEDGARMAGLPADYPPHVIEALSVLCDSLQGEAQLHWFGSMNSATMLRTGLAALLRIEKMFADDPTLADTPLESPVFVVGLPRSGTTFLHRLLSSAPEAMGIPMHRHMMPVVHSAPDLRRLDTHIKFLPWRLACNVYGLDAIHFVRPDLPDECNFGMRLGGRSIIYWATSSTPTYLDWLLAQDMRETYQLYRKCMILHQLANPGRRITLKCPHHLAWLPALTEAFPEAVIVQTHRDPVQIVPSESKLICSLQALSTHDLDWKLSVEKNQHKIKTYAERSVAFADTAAGARIHHLDYRALVADPVEAARTFHQAAGLPHADEHDKALADFFESNKQHKHGRNHYTAEQFGLTPEGLAEGYAPYRKRFLPDLV